MSKKAHTKRRKVDLSGFTAYSPSGVYPSSIPLSARAISSSSSPGPSLFNHIQINSEGAGKLSTSRTYMQAPPSPNKHGAPEPPLWNEEPDPAVDELLTPAQLDSTSEEYALDPDERKRRHWRSVGQSVWSSEQKVILLLTGSPATALGTGTSGFVSTGNYSAGRIVLSDALYYCRRWTRQRNCLSILSQGRCLVSMQGL
jgi:hypothetical protein